MRSVIATRYGGPDALRLVDAPAPVPAAGQVLVRVAASSVNPLDWHELRGRPYLVRIGSGLRRPRTPARGSDLAGTIEALGPDVDDLRVGDEVMGFGVGAWSDLAVVSARGLVRRPPGFGAHEAAGAGVAAITALQALRRGGLTGPRTWRPGEVEPMPPRILIIGATGGVGTYAVQLAKLFGAHVTAVTSTRNLVLAERIGADELIDYTTTALDDGLRRYDLVLELAGARPLGELARLLTPTGALVACGAPRGQWLGPLVSVAALAVRDRFSRRTFASILARRDRDDLGMLAELLATGALRTVVGEVLPLERIAEAVALSETGHARGKIIVDLAAP
ncbi:NAD(P)-dependent alcohol dehydrogenase [Microcella flavibacter]|uniref:NAD(P)-dependent alcohol dehydrogenase n=1 Tax=Microcella flavibacter TaxID=1804990 RepID=UPI0014572B30|nr:NAD(P)-dependent alcohol dehydrogenase [Microcella flavibacter]